MNAEEYVGDLIEQSRRAQQIFEQYDQEQVDRVVKSIGKAVYDHGEELGAMAAEETGMGGADFKTAKNRNKTMAVWWYLKDKKSVGILRVLEDQGLIEVAKPMGVVGAITPSTNPTMTPVHNAMITLKGRNSLLICPHPNGKRSGCKTVEYMREALRRVGAPEDLIIIIPEPTMELSSTVMAMTDVCITTGGAGVVKVAYRSGKPAFGVGAGNVQCLVDRDADPAAVAPKVICGRAFDNGISCTCEQSILCPRERYGELVEQLVKNGAYCVSTVEELERLEEVMFPGGGNANRRIIGRSAAEIAELARLPIPAGTQVLLAAGEGRQPCLGREKMFPVLSIFPCDSWEETIRLANANLALDGKGHSVVIHSHTQAHIEEAARRIPVSRFLVNGIGSSGLGGVFTNGLVPTGTLGCGSWGNNSISENLSYIHLINVSRIAYTRPNAYVPTPDEVWA